MRPLKYAIYKGMGGKWGAAQFSSLRSHWRCPSPKCGNRYFTSTAEVPICTCGSTMPVQQKEGVVFLEACSTIDTNKYDWENKISMALSVDDMGRLLYSLRTGSSLSLMHDPGAGTDKKGQIKKNLNFSSPKGVREGGMLNVTQTKGNDTIKHTIPLSTGELMVLGSLFQSAIPCCLGW